jgi:hypothetical protein
MSNFTFTSPACSASSSARQTRFQRAIVQVDAALHLDDAFAVDRQQTASIQRRSAVW